MSDRISAEIFIKLKKYNEAIALLRNLLNHASNRYDIYDKLVTAYRATNRLRDAQMTATEAVRVLGKTPRTYLVSCFAVSIPSFADLFARLSQLVAKPLLLDPSTRQKAKPFLKKALELNKNFTQAAMMLIELLEEEGDTAGAKQLTKNLLSYQPSSYLFTKLAGICSKEKDNSQALQYYMEAIQYVVDCVLSSMLS